MNPYTSNEKFYADAVNGNDPDPNTREEKFYKDLIENASGGGAALPPVTGADNGKVLGVVNGAWDTTQINIFSQSTTYTDDGQGAIVSFDINMSFGDILSAFKNGKNIYVNLQYTDTLGSNVSEEYLKVRSVTKKTILSFETGEPEQIDLVINLSGNYNSCWSATTTVQNENELYSIYPQFAIS